LTVLRNTIVSGNTAPSAPDINGFAPGPFNLIGGNAMLGPLQNNGGPTETVALLPGSPAIDAGDNTDAPEFDQRGPGFPRVVNGTIDIGAFEVQSTGAPVALLVPAAPLVRRGAPDPAVMLATADLDTDDLWSW
jgi:hypothetical protein